MRLSAFSCPCLFFAVALLACTRETPQAQPAQTSPEATGPTEAAVPSDAQTPTSGRADLTGAPEAKVPPPINCDGSIDAAEIPDAPLGGMINGRPLAANSVIVRTSNILKQISWDAAVVPELNPDQVCFQAGATLKGSLYLRTEDFNIPAGVYSFDTRNPDEKWRGMFLYEQENGTPFSVTPSVYGVIKLSLIHI